MAITTDKLVKLFRERLGKLESERERISGEIAELKAAFSGGAAAPAKRKGKRGKKTKKGKGGGVSATTLKKQSAAKKKAWAEVRKLGLKNLAELKAHKARHAKGGKA